jgi:prepilin-type N-terminal cleavage/methylation domain-containing protein
MLFFMKRADLKNKSGFSLIELLAAIAIFSTILIIITDLTLSAIRAEIVSANNQVALDSARFIFQRISKAIRVSVVKTPEAMNSSIIKLDHPKRGIVEYFMSADHHIIERLNSVSSTDSALDVSGTIIEDFHFNIIGADSGGADNRQPQVTVILKIKPPSAKNRELSSLNFQTTLSQRCLDINQACRSD